MEKLARELENFNLQGQILTKNYLNRYMAKLLKIYRANNYAKTLKYEESSGDYQSFYSYSKKAVLLCLDNIKKDTTMTINQRFDENNLYHIAMLNFTLITALTHECYHAVQYKISSNKKEHTLAANIFTDAINIMNYDLVLYHDLYGYFPIEVNAEIMTNIFAIDFLNSTVDLEDAFFNNQYAAEKILSFFRCKEDFVSPTEYFYKVLGEEKRYYDLISKHNLSDYQRMILGLPMTDSYINKLVDLSEGKVEVDNIKTYLKKK